METSIYRKRQPASYCFETKAYDQVQLIVVRSGELFFCCQESEVILESGMFVLLRESDAFRLVCRERGYAGIGVVQTGQLSAELKGPSLAGVIDNRLRLLVELVSRHMDAPLPESSHVLEGLGQALIWEVLALHRERGAGAERDWALAARTALDLNAGTGLPVRAALESLPLSYRQLARLFHDRYGVSPKAYQELLRVDEARRLLKVTGLDMTAISNELGYSSSQHFAASFRRFVGCTPTAYRQSVAATPAGSS